MGSQATASQAFPTNRIKGPDYVYNPGCGGRGAMGCPTLTSYSYIYWTIKPSTFAVRNRHLLLYNANFVPYNAVNDPNYPNPGSCVYMAGTTAYPYTIYLLYSLPAGNAFATNATAAKAIPSTFLPPFDLNFDAPNLLPQQNDPRWTGFIYVVADFGTTGIITGLPQNYELMKTTAFDYDERL